MERPSDRELFSKVNEALAAVSSGRYQFLIYKHFASDLEELGVTDEKELIDLVANALREILTARPANCWAGGRPPARSYEPEIKNLELLGILLGQRRLGSKNVSQVCYQTRRLYLCRLPCRPTINPNRQANWCASSVSMLRSNLPTPM